MIAKTLFETQLFPIKEWAGVGTDSYVELHDKKAAKQCKEWLEERFYNIRHFHERIKGVWNIGIDENLKSDRGERINIDLSTHEVIGEQW